MALAQDPRRHPEFRHGSRGSMGLFQRNCPLQGMGASWDLLVVRGDVILVRSLAWSSTLFFSFGSHSDLDSSHWSLLISLCLEG